VKRIECLISELPQHVRAALESMYPLPLSEYKTIGFTVDGVRYRVWVDEEAHQSVEVRLIADCLDAAKGADVRSRGAHEH